MKTLVLALMLIFGFAFVGCSDKPETRTDNTASASGNGTDAATSIEKQNEQIQVKKKEPEPDKKQICLDGLEQQKQSYQKLFDEKSYLEAADTLRPCARELQDQALLKLVENADILRYQDQINNTNSTPALRLRAINQLSDSYPEAGTKYQQVKSELEEIVYSKWEYATYEDEMTSKKTRIARIESSNEFYLDFPYDGPQRGVLQVRDHPRHGKDIIVTVQKGQILCSSYSGCPILARFDDNQPIKFTGSESNDSDSTIVFINNYSKFVDNLIKSKKVKISLGFFQNGSHVLEFDVAGFDKEQYPISAKKKKKK